VAGGLCPQQEIPIAHHPVPLCRYEHGQKYSAHWDVNDSPKRLEQMAAKGVLGGLRTATLLMYLSGEMTSTTGGTMCVYVAEVHYAAQQGAHNGMACCLDCPSRCRPSACPRFLQRVSLGAAAITSALPCRHPHPAAHPNATHPNAATLLLSFFNQQSINNQQ
jgi:hypothetical protein